MIEEEIMFHQIPLILKDPIPEAPVTSILMAILQRAGEVAKVPAAGVMLLFLLHHRLLITTTLTINTLLIYRQMYTKIEKGKAILESTKEVDITLRDRR
jgi:hypothetical protein